MTNPFISMSEIIGVSFPIHKWNINRFFENEKTVFIKPATVFKELKKGQKFIFYQSREDTGYAGEAIIKSITIRDDPLDFFEIFGETIFLTREEVRHYIEENKKWKSLKNRQSKKRKPRPWMAIELEKIKKYSEVKKIDGFVPVSGMYIKKDVENECPR
jgi:hypothetical protein